MRRFDPIRNLDRNKTPPSATGDISNLSDLLPSQPNTTFLDHPFPPHHHSHPPGLAVSGAQYDAGGSRRGNDLVISGASSTPNSLTPSIASSSSSTITGTPSSTLPTSSHFVNECFPDAVAGLAELPSNMSARICHQTIGTSGSESDQDMNATKMNDFSDLELPAALLTSLRGHRGMGDVLVKTEPEGREEPDQLEDMNDQGQQEMWESKAIDVDEEAKRRRRVSRACDLCRKMKVRCDALADEEAPKQRKGKGKAKDTILPSGPCGNCRKKGTECVFSHTPAKRRGPNKGYISLLEERIVTLESSLGDRSPRKKPRLESKTFLPKTSETQKASAAVSHPIHHQPRSQNSRPHSPPLVTGARLQNLKEETTREDEDAIFAYAPPPLPPQTYPLMPLPQPPPQLERRDERWPSNDSQRTSLGDVHQPPRFPPTRTPLPPSNAQQHQTQPSTSGRRLPPPSSMMMEGAPQSSGSFPPNQNSSCNQECCTASSSRTVYPPRSPADTSIPGDTQAFRDEFFTGASQNTLSIIPAVCRTEGFGSDNLAEACIVMWERSPDDVFEGDTESWRQDVSHIMGRAAIGKKVPSSTLGQAHDAPVYADVCRDIDALCVLSISAVRRMVPMPSLLAAAQARVNDLPPTLQLRRGAVIAALSLWNHLQFNTPIPAPEEAATILRSLPAIRDSFNGELTVVGIETFRAFSVLSRLEKSAAMKGWANCPEHDLQLTTSAVGLQEYFWKGSGDTTQGLGPALGRLLANFMMLYLRLRKLPSADRCSITEVEPILQAVGDITMSGSHLTDRLDEFRTIRRGQLLLTMDCLMISSMALTWASNVTAGFALSEQSNPERPCPSDRIQINSFLRSSILGMQEQILSCINSGFWLAQAVYSKKMEILLRHQIEVYHQTEVILRGRGELEGGEQHCYEKKSRNDVLDLHLREADRVINVWKEYGYAGFVMREQVPVSSSSSSSSTQR